MSNINFFTPVDYCTHTLGEKSLLEKVDDYFYLGGKRAYVTGMMSKDGQEKVILLESKPSSATTAKIASYCTIIIPLIMLVAKLVLRRKHTYKVVDLDQKINKGLSSNLITSLKPFRHLFDVKSPSEKATLLEIIKHDEAKEFTYVDKYNFDFKTPDGRDVSLAVARSAARQYGFHEDFELLGLDTKTPEGIADALEFIKIAAERHPDEVAKNITKYGLNPAIAEARKALFEIAKICAGHDAAATSRFLKNFGFDPKTSEGREMLLEVAKITLPQSAQFIRNYAFDSDTLEGQSALLEIFKIAASAKHQISDSIGTQCSFATKTPEGKAALLEIAKISARYRGADTSRYIANYGFDVGTAEGRAALLEIAKIAADSPSFYSFSEYIANYGFDAKTDEGKAALTEIAKINAVCDPTALSRHISNYGFDVGTPEGRDALIEIAKIVASQTNTNITDYLGNFGLYNSTPEAKTALIEIAKLSAKNNPAQTSTQIQDYGIDPKTQEGRAALFEIAKISANANGWSTVNFINQYRFDPNTCEGKAMLLEIGIIAMDSSGCFESIAKKMNKIIPHPVFDLFEACKSIVKFSYEVQKSCRRFPLILQLLAEVQSFKSDQVKFQLLPLIAYIHFKHYVYEGQLENVLPKWKETFVEMIKTRDPLLRSHLTSILFKSIEKNPEKDPSNVFETILQQLCAEKAIAPTENTLLKSIKKKDLKDATLQKTLLWTCIDLMRNEKVSGDTSQKVLKAAAEKASRTQIINELMKIRAILHMDGAEDLQQADLDLALKNLIQKKYPGLSEGVENLGERLNRTFLSSRNPFGIFTYAAGLATLPQEGLTEPLSLFFKSVLNGTFKEARQTTDKNPHLQEFKNKYPKLLEAWFKGDKLLDYALGEKKEEPKIHTRSILTNALVRDKHFPEVDSRVLAVLNETKSREEAFKEIVGKLKNTQKEAQAPLAVTRDLLRLLDPALKEEQRAACVDLIIKNLPPEGAELINDLKSLLPKKTAALTTVALCDTDDPFDIFYSGSDVAGSCQRIGGTPSLNRGLLGYLLNGQTRIITLKQSHGANVPITARAIIRLQFNEMGEPVMLMERIYPQILSQEMKDALVGFALKRATALGIDLVSIEEGSPDHIYPGAIKSLGGFVPEYVDSAGGIQSGRYEVNGACKVVS